MCPSEDESRRASVVPEEGSGIVGVYWPSAKATLNELLPGAEDGHEIPSLTDIK